MSFASPAQALSAVNLLPAASRSAGAVNGDWVAVSQYEGDLHVVINFGSITGNQVVKLQDATDDSGTGVGDITGATTAAITTANSTATIIVPANSVRSHLRVVATTTTGPVLSGATMQARPKYVG